MTRHEAHDRQHSSSAASYHSLNTTRYGSDPGIAALSSHGVTSSRNPIQVPHRARNGSGRYDRDHNMSPESYGSVSQSPQMSPPNLPTPIMGDHRRELAVLQTPQFVLRQNPPSVLPSPSNGNGSPGATFLNSSIFDNQEQYQLSPHRPSTALSTGSQGQQGPTDSYFPDETRRPSVASVVTNASSTGSKSSIGRSIYKKIFGDGENNNDSPGSSESSLPSNTTPRSHYGFPRPATPTGSRPRTPLPPAEVVPFLYQDPDDIRRLGVAPIQDTPVHDKQFNHDEITTGSTYTNRITRGRRQERDKALDKELPRPPTTAFENPFPSYGYPKNLKLHLDGTASLQSSVTRLPRSGSPTPSVASSLSNNAPRSPGELGGKHKGLWAGIGKLVKGGRDRTQEIDKEGASTHGSARRLGRKVSEPMLNGSNNGISPAGLKRGSGSQEHVHPRALDYASVDQVSAAKSTGKVPENKVRGVKLDMRKDSRRKGRAKLGPEQDAEVQKPFQLSTDFSDIGTFVKRTEPGPDSSWLIGDEPTAGSEEVKWEPPESWATKLEFPEEDVDKVADEESGPEETQGAQYCIRVFRADTTFATLSCKLQASVTEVLDLLGRKSFLQDNLANYQIVMRKNGLARILAPNERPLKIQKRLFEQAGYTEDDHLDEIGREDHGYLVRFTFMMARTGGYSLDQDPGLTKVQKFSHVDLQGRNLLTIPITLYHKAPEIISLNLSRNLSLNIPKDFIQQCVNLRKIEFNGNDCERLPPSMSAASRLTYLDISNNRLEELDHATLEEHSALVALKMSNNRLRSLPNTFGQFRSLRTLHIQSNYLTAFPQFICELVTLVDLDISFNSIRSFPLEIGQLSALERLNATNNRLIGTLPTTFAMLGSLKELDLRFNRELQNIDIVSELPRLEAVVVSHNRISGFQHSFQKLRALHLNSNPVTRFSLPTAMPTLTFLNLSNAKIAAINETLYEKLPNLLKLILDKNHIVSFPPQIAKLKKLEHLSCYSNDVAQLPKEIGLLQDLKYLDLHFNNLKVLPGEIWQLSNLVTLNLSSNLIKEFPKPVTNPIGLRTNNAEVQKEKYLSEKPEADLQDGSRRPSGQSGGLLSVGQSPGQNGRKGSMVSIYGPGGRKASVVSKSSIETAGTVAASAGLRKDSASSNKMSYTFIFSLRYLYLADNRLSDEVFEELSLLSELRVLNLSYNDLYDIPSRALSRMGNLNELYLSGNELTALPAEDLEFIPNLKVLHLNGNKFQTLPAELGKIRKLLVLDVGNNSLKYNISNWPYDWNWNWNLDLKYLNLSGNKRLEIKPNRNDSNASRENITDFSALSKLRVLGLMDVTLTIPNVPDETEDRRVRLSGTMVRTMAYGMADSLGRNEHLSIIDMVVPDFRGSTDEWVIGLFDGQALPTGGSKVSKFLHQSIVTHLTEELNKDHRPEVALRRAFLNMNKDLAASAMQTVEEKTLTGAPRHPSSGSGPLLGPDDLNSGGAATVVYMVKNEIYVANVGDCMAVLVQPRGDFKVLTTKHDPGSTSELERIRDAGGWVSRTGKLNDILDTSRAFGYFQAMPSVNAAPDIGQARLNEHDQEELLIIATKELWEYITPQSAVDIARTEKDDLMRAAQKLRDFAISYGATGKIMVMVLGVGNLRKSKRQPTHSVNLPGTSLITEDHQIPVFTGRKTRRGEQSDNSELARLPGEVKAPDGELAMVFTDIKSSTLLWETFPVAMRSGIKIHNTLMRRQLRNVGGYEVKTEGDAFMVCFHTVTSALLWAFSVQNYLLEQEWPNEILESEAGREVHDEEGNLIYRGLSVRMGIHWGSPVCEPDPITGRMDYFGPMVNRAARITAEADGGQITVSSDTVAEVNRCVKAYLESTNDDGGTTTGEEAFGDAVTAQTIIRELRLLSQDGFEVKELGERKLKGLENPEVIYLMYPHSLKRRLDAPSVQIPAPVTRQSLNPDDVWALWDISNRLEMVCSALNTEGIPMAKSQSTDMSQRLRDAAGDNITDQALLPIIDHAVSRIENSMLNLYIRKLLAPNPNSTLGTDTAGSLVDLLGALESRLGVTMHRGMSSNMNTQTVYDDSSSPSSNVSPLTDSHSVSMLSHHSYVSRMPQSQLPGS
ncbi:hypothetical protein EDC01DRAFT_631149 [Geopyxis carbonaria]|nr:hypothetical protein EDC01DRAFT_631149 [Geopyxis carbonaria]